MSVSNIFESLEPLVKSLGYDLVKVDSMQRGGQRTITVYIDFDIDSEEFISLQDCEKVHRAISEELDKINPTNDKPYTLNVSSLGLDWNIQTERDFKKNFGKKLVARFYAPIEGKKQFCGDLIEFDEETFVLKDEKHSMKLEKKQVAKLEKYLDFSQTNKE